MDDGNIVQTEQLKPMMNQQNTPTNIIKAANEHPPINTHQKNHPKTHIYGRKHFKHMNVNETHSKHRSKVVGSLAQC